MAEIEFDDVTKRYPDGFEAVKHMDLDIVDGEFIILVPPRESDREPLRLSRACSRTANGSPGMAASTLAASRF